MLTKKLTLTKKLALTALGLAAAAPAFANPPYHARAYGWHERGPVVRYYPVAPVVVRPYLAPRYVYALPPAVIYRPVPVAPPAPTFSFRLDLPL